MERVSIHSGFCGTVPPFYGFQTPLSQQNKKFGHNSTYLTMCTNILISQWWDKLSIGVRQPLTSC